MKKETLGFLQTQNPLLRFEDWYCETIKLFADEWKISSPLASQRLSIDKLKEWWQDGFTPYSTFRENFQPLY